MNEVLCLNEIDVIIYLIVMRIHSHLIQLDSVDRRLKSTSQELEKAQQARAELER